MGDLPPCQGEGVRPVPSPSLLAQVQTFRPSWRAASSCLSVPGQEQRGPLMQFLWKYVDDLVGKGLEWYLILKLLFYASATFFSKYTGT